MPRTRDEHHIVLSHFDNFFVFGYLYESERQRNPDLETLRGFAAEIDAKADQSINAATLTDPERLRGLICRVMNVLQRACKANNPEIDGPVDASWDGLPDKFASEDLWRLHSEHRNELIHMFETVLSRLSFTFSEDLRPYVTPELVAATFRELRREGQIRYAGPVPVNVLSAIAHQAFVAGLTTSQAPLGSPMRVDQMVDTYVKQANQSFQHLVTSGFVYEMVKDLFPRARRLNISLDRIYPWGALWEAPYYAHSLLVIYSDLITSGIIKNSKHSPKDKTGEAPRDDLFEAFDYWAVNTLPEPRIPSSDPIPKTCFHTDDTDILIDGNFLQHHAVLAIRYDQPLPDVERAMRGFRNVLLAQRNRYCANAGVGLTSDETKLSNRPRQEIIPINKTNRRLVQDVSAITGHMCAMIHIEKMRETLRDELPKKTPYAEMLKKNQVDLMFKMLDHTGFDLDPQTIQKAIAKIPAQCNALRSALLKEHARD